ncbi:MAG: TonB-dependent receptor [Rhodothermales bacterium]|nr:TonB-dependent receptor [Rhodothermales bacterium]
MGQNTASISGFVKDATSGETLLLANVVLLDTDYGAATNNSGYYAMNGLPAGDYIVIGTYIGYQPLRIPVTLQPGQARRLDIELSPESVMLEGVTVTAEKELEEEIRRIGVTQMTTEIVRQVPTILEPDVFRSLQLLPGVKAASDYSSGLYIRGGSPDQTLILLDRTTVYNPTHFFGFFSTFNPDAIKDVRLYKGGYPAEYGGRLGSVVDIYNKDGNRLKTQGGLSLGLLASRAILEGPYKKGSWMLAVRRSTLEPLLGALRKADVDGIPDGFYFIDVNGKLNFDAGENDRLSVAFYGGTDELDLPFVDDARIKLAYGNRTLSTNWTHLFNQKLFSNFTLTYSRYFNRPLFSIAGSESSRTNNVYDLSAKGDFEYIPNERHQFEVGFWSGMFTLRLRDTFDDVVGLEERIQSPYLSVYAQEIFRPKPDWQIQAGLRANYFDQGRYFRLEPRLSAEHRPDENIRLQLGYGRYYQFLTLISSELFSGFDLWLTTDDGVEPAYGDQFVAGLKTNIGADLQADVEVYYRTMRQLFQLDPFLPDAAGLAYSDLFTFGEGFAYGTELLLQKPKGRLNGFIGYTIGLTKRRFPDINNFDYYPPKYDRRHEVNIVGNYSLSRKWSLTSVFNLASGQAYTEPASQYRLVDDPFTSGSVDVLISPFNDARLPMYHRLDVGFARKGKFFRFAESELQLQLINVYNRRNIWFYFFEFEDDNTVTRNEIPQIPVPIPNVSFSIRF